MDYELEKKAEKIAKKLSKENGFPVELNLDEAYKQLFPSTLGIGESSLITDAKKNIRKLGKA